MSCMHSDISTISLSLYPTNPPQAYYLPCLLHRQFLHDAKKLISGYDYNRSINV